MNSGYIDKKLFAILLLSLLMAIFPIIGFVFALLFYREKWALLLMVLFSFYFGWFYELRFDLLSHYNDFKSLEGLSFFDCYNNKSTLHIGKEPYHILFKYLLLKISDNSNFFSACACMVYTSIFTYGIMAFLRPYYKNNIPTFLCPIFILVICIIEFYWFGGLRFWTGFFVFSSFYLRYLKTNSRKYLILSCSCLAFHFALLGFCVVAVINEVFNKNIKVQYIAILFSFLMRYLGLPIVSMIAKMRIFGNLVNISYTDSTIVNNVIEFSANFRNTGNIFYLIRSDIIFISALIILYIIYNYRNSMEIFRNKYWSFLLWLYSVVNIGYSNITFYDRFYKGFLFLLYVFLFVQILKLNNYLLKRDKVTIFATSLISAIYAILTALIIPRELLWRTDLWFNSLCF